MKSSSVGVIRVMTTVKLCVLLSISYLLINIYICGVYTVTAAVTSTQTTSSAQSSLIKSNDFNVTPKKSQITAHKTRHKHGQRLRIKDNSLWDLFNDYQRSIVPANERFAHNNNNSKKVVWKKQDKNPPSTRSQSDWKSKIPSTELKYNYETAMTPPAQINNSNSNNNYNNPSSRQHHQMYFNKTPTRNNHHNHNVLVNVSPMDNKDPSRVFYKTMQHITTTTIRTTTTVKYENNDVDDDEDYLDDTTVIETASIRTASARSYRGTDSQNPNGLNADGTEVGDGSLTRAKQAEYGNYDAVERNFRKELELKSRAQENLVRTRKFGECRWPKMEVVYIDSSDRSKRYEPHATMLHRCNNRTACCHNDSLTCVAKRMERVTVVFSVFNMLGQLDHHKSETFDNHTECHCIQKVIISTFRSPFRTVKPTKNPCLCPSLFQKVSRNEDDHCVCDCWDNNEDCIQLRQGNGYLTLMDRQCINNQHCAEPSCEFGRFLTTQGRCTRREEKVNAGRHAG